MSFFQPLSPATTSAAAQPSASSASAQPSIPPASDARLPTPGSPEGKLSSPVGAAGASEEARETARREAIGQLRICAETLEKELAKIEDHPYGENLRLFIGELQSAIDLLSARQLTAEEVVPRLFNTNRSGLLSTKAWIVWTELHLIRREGLGIDLAISCASPLGGKMDGAFMRNLHALPGWSNNVRESSKRGSQIDMGGPMCSDSSPVRVMFGEHVLLCGVRAKDGAIVVACPRELEQLGRAHKTPYIATQASKPLVLGELMPLGSGEAQSGTCYYVIMPSDLAKLTAVALAPKEAVSPTSSSAAAQPSASSAPGEVASNSAAKPVVASPPKVVSTTPSRSVAQPSASSGPEQPSAPSASTSRLAQSAAPESKSSNSEETARQAAIAHLEKCIEVLEEQLAKIHHPYSENLKIFIIELQAALYLLGAKKLSAEEVVPRLFKTNVSGLLSKKSWMSWKRTCFSGYSYAQLGIVAAVEGNRDLRDRTLTGCGALENLSALPGWDARVSDSVKNKDNGELGGPICSGSSTIRVIFGRHVCGEPVGREDGALVVCCKGEIPQLGHAHELVQKAILAPPLELDKLKPISPSEARTRTCYYCIMPSDFATLPAVAPVPQEDKGK
jgi:hypothetical protein